MALNLNGAGAGAAVGGALGGPGGAMLGGAVGGSNVGGVGNTLGDALANAWSGFDPLNRGKYDPYNPDPANFQDPNAAAAAARYQQGITDAQGRQAPQIDPYWSQGNKTLADQLAALGSGQGPSLAGAQFDQGHQAGLAANASLAGSAATAGNPALASRMLAQTQAGANQAAAGQRGILALQEQASARGQLANVLAQGQQGEFAGANLALENQRQIDGMTQFYESLGYSREEANRQAQIEMERIKAGAYGQAQGYGAAADAQNAQTKGALLGGLINAGGTAAAALSDERQKFEVREPDGARMQAFLDSLDAKDYQYRDPSLPGAAPGQQTGVMAQDVASTPVGAQMVKQSPNGLMLDPARGLGSALAGLGHLNERMKKVEEGVAPQMATERLPESAGGLPEEPSTGRRILDAIMKSLGGAHSSTAPGMSATASGSV